MNGKKASRARLRPIGHSSSRINATSSMILNDEPRMNSTTLSAIQNATCTIVPPTPEGTGTGFLARIELSLFNKTLFGLITNNDVLPSSALVPNSIISLRFEASQSSATLKITPDTFCFTDPLLDCTFVSVELGPPEGPLTPSNFIPVNVFGGVCQRVWIGPHIGRILCNYGFDYLHDVTVDSIASGTALCDCEGRAVGVHKERDRGKGCNTATQMHYILLALQNTLGSQRSTQAAKTLCKLELEELDNHGLKATANPYVFISPASAWITALWFYRTNHAWYWTPTRPDAFEIEDLKMCNWSVIWGGEPDQAIGGYWDKCPPAPRNRSLIAWISSTAFRFLQ
jgi:hypothetical protein